MKMKSTLLISGGTGFLGQKLAMLLKDRYSVVLTGRNNNQNREAQRATGCQILPMDVTNIESVRDVFSEIRPQIVIHSAASKYVDLAEKFPLEAIDINIHGAQNVARVAIEKGVESVIGMSSDKAAQPIANTYGLTKALMERLFCAMNEKAETRFTSVRHGNIMWSTGSVFPEWKRMHETTGVISSTGPDMTRYFASCEEAMQLVTVAMDNIEWLQGKVLVKQMKASRLRDILEVWVRHKGGTWQDVGARAGERSQEYLVGYAELRFAYEKDINGLKYYVIDFSRPSPAPPASVLGSDDAERFTEPELLKIIDNAYIRT